MSLINEALKKAQRLRREEAADVAEQEVAVPSVTRIAKRGRARAARMIVLLASGAAMLIVLSTTLTVYLINRTPAPPARPAPARANLESDNDHTAVPQIQRSRRCPAEVILRRSVQA